MKQNPTYVIASTDIDLKDYLWWVTIELELMRTKCERRWGGAW